MQSMCRKPLAILFALMVLWISINVFDVDEGNLFVSAIQNEPFHKGKPCNFSQESGHVNAFALNRTSSVCAPSTPKYVLILKNGIYYQNISIKLGVENTIKVTFSG